MYHPVKYFDEKLYICEICNKHLNKNEISRQKVYIKILDPIPDELKDLKRLEKLQENFQENFVEDNTKNA